MPALSALSMRQSIERQARLTRNIGDLETAIATGRKLNAPSDAPEIWTEVSDLSRRRADIAATRDTIGYASARAAAADRWLGALTDDLARARELVVAAGGTPGAGRPALVSELSTIATSLPGRFAATNATGEPVLDPQGAHRISLGDGQQTDIVPQSDTLRLLPDGTPLSDVFDRAIAAATSGTPADVAAALTALDAATGHLTTEQARQGIRMQRLESAAVTLAESDASLSVRQSAIGDTDIAAAITTIQTLAVQRDAARAMLSRTAGQTLFDYLR